MGELRDNSTWSAHDVLGRNPFPEGDPRPQYWTNVSLWVSERLAKLSSVMLSKMPPEEASYKEFPINEWTPEGRSVYEALLVKLQKRFSHRFQGQLPMRFKTRTRTTTWLPTTI
jgi:hypothetical protein